MAASGLGYLEHCVAMEEISRASASGRLSYGAHSNLLRQSVAPQRHRGAAPQISAQADSGRARPARWRCRSQAPARRGVDAHPRHKKGDRYSSTVEDVDHHGPVADTVVVYAKTDRTAGARGITAFVVEKGMKGFAPAQKLDKLGMRGSDTSELVFIDCEVPRRMCWARSATASTC